MPPLAGFTPGQKRYDTIDLMRGVVIATVVLFHSYLRFQQEGFNIAEGMPLWLRDLLFSNGMHSMAAMFTVSGFIIAYTTIKRFGSLAEISLKRFYRLRFSRIIPPLLLIVVVLSLLHGVHLTGFTIKASQHETLPRTVLSVLTFHLNWYESVHGLLPICWDVLWTLSIEEAFYLIFPLLCVGLLRFRGGLWIFVSILLLLVAVGPPSRTVWAFNDVWARKSYLSATDGIALGVLTAMLTERARGWSWISHRRLVTLQCCGVLLLVSICSGVRWFALKPYRRAAAQAGVDETIVAVALCLVMFAAVLRNNNGLRALKPARWFGIHSYELYLTHEFVVIAMSILYIHWQHLSFAFWIVSTLVLTAPVGWAFATFYSEPINRRLRGTIVPVIAAQNQGSATPI